MVKVNKEHLNVSCFVFHSYLLFENEPTHLSRREWRWRDTYSSTYISISRVELVYLTMNSFPGILL